MKEALKEALKALRSAGLAAVAALLLAACGGSDDAPAYSKVVVFGDSLSDVGTHASPGVRAEGGGKYTVNSAGARLWVELIAAAAGAAAPCAAKTGLEASDPLDALAAPVTDVANCFDYAQGGSRVTNPVGPYNKALLPDPQGLLGQITDPVLVQMMRHLAVSGGAFAAGDLVLVLAGGNDVFMNLRAVGLGVATANDATAAMGTAGGELAGYVKNLVVAKGATRVVVVNLPDVSKTPFAYAEDAATQGLIQTMSNTFNQQLGAGVSGVAEVLLVDAYTQSQEQAAQPANYGISDATAPACELTPTLARPLAAFGSLLCDAPDLIAGDTSRFLFADDVHPTPYGHQLLADRVAADLRARGWL